MKRPTRLGLLVLALTLSAPLLGGCGNNSPSKPHSELDKIAELSVDDVEARLAKNDGSFLVYDVNPREVFDKGRVPSARWIEEVTPDVLPADKSAALMFYCANER